MFDHKRREYSYISHKDHYPLELTGNMKRKMRPNTAHPSKDQNQDLLSFGNNDTFRQKLANKIADNYQDLKCVIPVELDSNKKQSRIKTYQKENTHGYSGATYLMIKSNQKTDHAERRHIDQCAYITTDHKIESERKHFNNQYGKQTNKQWQCPKPHPETLKHKIANDLYANAQRRDRAYSSHVKISQRNMFTQGTTLGLQTSKSRRTSCAKHREMMGQYCMASDRTQSRVMRDDWRKSSFILG